MPLMAAFAGAMSRERAGSRQSSLTSVSWAPGARLDSRAPPRFASSTATSSPWVVREARREQRDRSTLTSWLPQPAAPPAFEGQIGEMQAEAERLWKNTRLNQAYIPLSKLPPLGPDPRRLFAGRPPACCPTLGDSRALRIIERWESMPQLPSQLDSPHLRTIEEVETMAKLCNNCGKRSPFAQPRSPTSQSWSIDELSRFKSTSTASPRGKRSEPTRIHIRCTCCERPQPKPWMESRPTVGAIAQACIDAAMDKEDPSETRQSAHNVLLTAASPAMTR